MNKHLSIAAVIALAGTAAACSSDEPSSKQDYPQPAATMGAEATPEPPTTQPPTQAPTQAQPQTTVDETVVEETVVPMAQTGMSRPGDEPIAESLRDGQIMKITDLANSGEVKQAQLARTKATNPQVKQFAAMMIKEHSQANQMGMQLGKSAGIVEEQSPQAGKLELKAEQTMETLKAVGTTGFDMAYMNAQVEQHQSLLTMLNETMIPSATNMQLKAELEATRTMVQRHLGHAKQIQETLSVARASAIEE